MNKAALALAFLLGLLLGILGLAALESWGAGGIAGGSGTDPRQAGLPWVWLAFGFAAQALFAGRMLLQWVASERAKQSVVPAAFWWLSLVGGLMLLAYFVRRGDPVGVVGQLFGVVVYARNLVFIRRDGSAD